MIHSSCVWLACVLRTRPGIATFSDAMAAETAPRATQTTAVTRPRLPVAPVFPPVTALFMATLLKRRNVLF
jgi:hypothetical protein